MKTVIVLAGDLAPWLAEYATLPKVGEYYDSNALCRLQMNQAGRGFCEARLVRSIHGWSIRYASGLNNFDLIYPSRNTDPSEALKVGQEWVKERSGRVLTVSRFEIEQGEKKGDNCECLRAFITE